ncbi:hypothetical protein QMT40_000570 [Parvibaculaceae bacterium PLY_AMNH_Bact1]|nr:hypothetical protein QMT40_000570 [Parvibaculaceae bacterium PLY_AMNH_Bact1]
MDQFGAHTTSLESPASSAVAITPSDENDLAQISRAVYVGGAGDLAVTMKDGSIATFKNLIGGTVMAIRVARVLSTGTTATHIVAMS